MNSRTLIGTHEDFKVGEIILNHDYQHYGEYSKVSIKIIRETNEAEYRQYHNYNGPLPADPSYPSSDKPARFFEVEALD